MAAPPCRVQLMEARLSAGMFGVLFGLLGFAAFSAHDALIKHLAVTYAVPQIIFFTALFALPMLLVSMRFQPGATLIPRHPWWVAFRTVGHLMAGIGSFYAFSHLPLAEVYAFLFATPLVIAALSFSVLGEWVGLRRWIAVVCGLVGVLIVLQPGRSDLGTGHLAAVIAMVGGAIVSLVFRRIGRTESNAAMLFYPMVVNLGLMGALLPGLFRMPSGLDLGLNVGIAALGFAGMSCLYLAYRRARATVVAPMQYSQIVWAVLFGALIFNEGLTPNVVLGVAVIMASGLYILLHERNGAVLAPET